MRVPLPWLREYCDPPLDVHAIEERLTMTGTKVEAIHHFGVPATDGFVVGRVLSAEQHPDADRLKVCKVDLGDARATAPSATIVCGAPNVAAGQTVAVARPGAVMPDGTKLKQAKLRGVVSEGMILSESELELERELAKGSSCSTASCSTPSSRPGTPLAEVLPISMDVLELEITPNRPDCLGVYGVARELHAATGAPLAPAPWSEDPGTPGPRRRRRGDPRVPRAVPALHRARVRERHDRALAAVAEGAAGGRRAARRSTTSSTSPTTRCCSAASRCTRSTSTASPARA